MNYVIQLTRSYILFNMINSNFLVNKFTQNCTKCSGLPSCKFMHIYLQVNKMTFIRLPYSTAYQRRKQLRRVQIF